MFVVAQSTNYQLHTTVNHQILQNPLYPHQSYCSAFCVNPWGRPLAYSTVKAPTLCQPPWVASQPSALITNTSITCHEYYTTKERTPSTSSTNAAEFQSRNSVAVSLSSKAGWLKWATLDSWAQTRAHMQTPYIHNPMYLTCHTESWKVNGGGPANPGIEHFKTPLSKRCKPYTHETHHTHFSKRPNTRHGGHGRVRCKWGTLHLRADTWAQVKIHITSSRRAKLWTSATEAI